MNLADLSAIAFAVNVEFTDEFVGNSLGPLGSRPMIVPPMMCCPPAARSRLRAPHTTASDTAVA